MRIDPLFNPRVTFAYFTSRRDPKFEWFVQSLRRELGHEYPNGHFDLVIVDLWRNERDLSFSGMPASVYCHWVEPKPNVWQGKYRLTKADYFAASNARNTAICLARHPYIVFVDDLSVLMPGWWRAVNDAIRGNYIVCGAYRKVKDLVVADGEVKSFTDHPAGHDHRWAYGNDYGPVDCGGNWMYGCSLAAPVEAFLSINGWPEACDGMGYEDAVCGMAISRNGYRLKYDRRMLSYESEELHAQFPVMLREDPCRGDSNAKPRDDMSHAMLRIYANATRFENYFGPAGIRGLREMMMGGYSGGSFEEPFPVQRIPEHRWFDSKPLRELPA